LASPWQALGKPLARPWQALGKPLASPWQALAGSGSVAQAQVIKGRCAFVVGAMKVREPCGQLRDAFVFAREQSSDLPLGLGPLGIAARPQLLRFLLRDSERERAREKGKGRGEWGVV
jgi:hypothetical protein